MVASESGPARSPRISRPPDRQTLRACSDSRLPEANVKRESSRRVRPAATATAGLIPCRNTASRTRQNASRPWEPRPSVDLLKEGLRFRTKRAASLTFTLRSDGPASRAGASPDR